VGPFSIPSVKLTNSLVSHANDLNPASIQWLRKSVEINKLPQATPKQIL
jgi:tRNA G37 N-methylase Trm5